MFGVDSQISKQRPYPYAAEFNPAPLTLAESAMKLRLRLLHGEDLIGFFNALARQNAGLFLIDECKMQRIDTGGVRFQPNLMAECELSWVTAKPRSGNGEKTVKQLITLASDKEQDAAPVAEILTLGGSVRRSDGKSTASGEKAAATASTPEQKVLEAQPESALERLRRTRREGNDNEPDRR